MLSHLEHKVLLSCSEDDKSMVQVYILCTLSLFNTERLQHMYSVLPGSVLKVSVAVHTGSCIAAFPNTWVDPCRHMFPDDVFEIRSVAVRSTLVKCGGISFISTRSWTTPVDAPVSHLRLHTSASFLIRWDKIWLVSSCLEKYHLWECANSTRTFGASKN